MKRARSFVDNNLKQFDQFGYPVALTFEGEQQYKTRYGGVVSLMIYFVAAMYSLIRFTYMITRSNP